MGSSTEAQFIAQGSYYSVAKGQCAITSTTETEDEAHSGAAAVAKILTEPSPGFHLGGSLFYSSVGNHVLTNKTPTVTKTDNDAYSITYLALDTAWEINPSNGLKASLTYSLGFSSSSKNLATGAKSDYDYEPGTGVNLSWVHQF